MTKRILVVIEPIPCSRAAVEEGIALARLDDAELVFFHVLPRCPVPMVDELGWAAPSEQAFDRAAREEGQRLLATAAACAEAAGVMHRCVLGHGLERAACIAEAARKRRCELIVVASEGRNAVVRLLTGSVIPGLISVASVPVMVCKEGGGRGAGRDSTASRRRRVQPDSMARVSP